MKKSNHRKCVNCKKLVCEAPALFSCIPMAKKINVNFDGYFDPSFQNNMPCFKRASRQKRIENKSFNDTFNEMIEAWKSEEIVIYNEYENERINGFLWG